MVIDRVMMRKTASPLFSAVFHLFLSILAGNYEMHEISEDFELWPDLTTDCGVSCPLAFSCPLAAEKIPIDL